MCIYYVYWARENVKPRRRPTELEARELQVIDPRDQMPAIAAIVLENSPFWKKNQKGRIPTYHR